MIARDLSPTPFTFTTQTTSEYLDGRLALCPPPPPPPPPPSAGLYCVDGAGWSGLQPHLVISAHLSSDLHKWSDRSWGGQG